jgi:hypothetical protein
MSILGAQQNVRLRRAAAIATAIGTAAVSTACGGQVAPEAPAATHQNVHANEVTTSNTDTTSSSSNEEAPAPNYHPPYDLKDLELEGVTPAEGEKMTALESIMDSATEDPSKLPKDVSPSDISKALHAKYGKIYTAAQLLAAGYSLTKIAQTHPISLNTELDSNTGGAAAFFDVPPIN